MTTARELVEGGIELERLLDCIPSVIIGVDGEGCVVYWNTPAERIFGLAATDTLGKTLEEIGLPWDGEAVRRYLDRCRQSAADWPRTEIKFIGADGQNRIFGMSYNQMDFSGRRGFVLLGADITEKVRMEHELRQAQRLESIGRLASGIAHEINTPIQFVGDNIRFLHESFQDLLKLLSSYREALNAAEANSLTSEIIAAARAAEEAADLPYLEQEIPQSVSQTLDGVERVANIVRAMKDFAHQDLAEKAPADLNRALETTLIVARNEIKYVADVETDLDQSLPAVICHEGRLKQVFLNLLVNAAHAIADHDGRDGQKGRITVATRREGSEARISISDTGGGIPPEIRDRIYDPFFTTKEVGRGSGQGLAIARSVVVEKHGGSIEFTSEMGKGTTFVVRLPIEPEATGKRKGAL